MDRKEQLMKIFSVRIREILTALPGNPAAGGQAFDDFI